MSKPSPLRKSSARRNAEAILSQNRKREESFKIEQKLAQNATAEKTARLRELRLAKEAADKKGEDAKPPSSAPKASKGRKLKQT